MVKNFKDLAVYQRAESLADELRRSTSAWEQFDRWTVGVQMLRAADSVGANIAEGWGRDTRRDRRRFLFLARGSSCELEHWIRRADARLLPVPRGAGDRVEEVSRMLNGLLRAWS